MQSDKKDQIDILTNNHDKKYNWTKQLKRLQFSIYEDVYWEWSVSEYRESRIKPYVHILLALRFKPPSPCLLFFKVISRQEQRWKPYFYKQ